MTHIAKNMEYGAPAIIGYFVARDAYGDVCLWADTTNPWDYEYTFGPRIVLTKRDADPAVWQAACAALAGGTDPALIHTDKDEDTRACCD